MTKAIELSQLGSVLGVDQSTGNVGLGTNSPETDFQVRNGTGGTIKVGGSGTDATGFSINYSNSGTTTTTIKQHYHATNGAALLRIDTGTFLIATGTPITERLCITSGGIVLINDTYVSTNRADAPLQIETGGNGNALNLRTRSSDNIYSYLNFQNNAGSQTAAHIYLERDASTNAGTLVFGTAVANANTPSEKFYITSNGNVGVGTNNPAAKLDVNGDVFPTTDATHDLGSASKRWANIYSADLQLSNEGSPTGNEIDGTWGAYTVQEGEEELFLINRRSGKKFKFVLEEVN